ncbi:hypothetical protein [Actinomadura sp. NPDC049753]|uniref:hypothetical protein n=1 Tax=Actinomadura sp. NPDC049753 TaxID=3154739 RepID=UPI003433AE5E
MITLIDGRASGSGAAGVQTPRKPAAGRTRRRARAQRERRELQQTRERAGRRTSNAARNPENAGLPRIFAGVMKRGAQELADRAGRMHIAHVSDVQARLDEAGRALLNEQKITLQLPATHVPAQAAPSSTANTCKNATRSPSPAST